MAGGKMGKKKGFNTLETWFYGVTKCVFISFNFLKSSVMFLTRRTCEELECKSENSPWASLSLLVYQQKQRGKIQQLIWTVRWFEIDSHSVRGIQEGMPGPFGNQSGLVVAGSCPERVSQGQNLGRWIGVSHTKWEEMFLHNLSQACY